MIRIENEKQVHEGRFALYENDIYAGELTYVFDKNHHLVAEHTRVGEEHKGKGFGKELIKALVQYAREEKIKVVPICSFIKKVFDRDESLNDIKV
ncbi:MAG: GNAT family N-acetyltransferase [Prevotella sp.]